MNYIKLFKDIESGELDPKSFTLIVDNDYIWLRDNLHEDWDLTEKRERLLEETYGNGDGYRDLVKVMIASGLNAEWC